jgi:SH3 domain-containing YSC84-like protein 1
MRTKLYAVLALGAGFALGAPLATDRLMAAADAFNQVMGIRDKAVPQDLMNKAQCIVIVPQLKEGAFVFGGKYGKGFIFCRKDSGVGWSAPAAIRMEGGSFGLQIGGEEIDVFMLIMNKRGMDKLLSTKFTIGGDMQASAGPVGRSTQAETDAAMSAEILTYSRSKGLFAGMAITGATLRPDDDWNKELYGSALKNRDIVTGNTAPPAAAADLLAALNKYSPRK